MLKIVSVKHFKKKKKDNKKENKQGRWRTSHDDGHTNTLNVITLKSII